MGLEGFRQMRSGEGNGKRLLPRPSHACESNTKVTKLGVQEPLEVRECV